jgi:hypothetical protein
MQGVSSTAAARQSTCPPGARALGFIALGVALLTVSYWVIWYAGGRDLLASAHTPEYFAFENAFPAADGWLALCALISGIQLLRGRSSAIFWLFLTAGCGLYLGLMDVLFDVENGIYLVPKGGDPVAVGIEIAINVLTFATVSVSLWWAWRNRSWITSAPNFA